MTAAAPGPERAAEAWRSVAHRYEAYVPLMPGNAAFRCQPQECDAHCCRNLSVSIGHDEAAAMEAAGHGPMTSIVEHDGNEPLILPLARPMLLARREGQCVFLDSEDLSCGAYDSRPAPCHLYPHQVILVDPVAGRPIAANDPAIRDAALARALGTDASEGPVALLLRHVECPGFTEPAHDTASWKALLADIAARTFAPA